MFDRKQEILIDALRLFITGGPQAFLSLKAGPLVHGIVQLGECVGDLYPAGEELESFDKTWVIGSALGQRRDVDGIVTDERGLNQRRLDVAFEERLDQLAGRGRDEIDPPLGGLFENGLRR